MPYYPADTLAALRTVAFSTVLDGVAHLAGIDLATLAAGDKARIVEFINQRVREGWEHDFWPEWTVVEERPFRRRWNADDVFEPGREVFFATDRKYYAANSAPNEPAAGESPESAPTKWTLIADTALERYLARDVCGEIALGEVAFIYRTNPGAAKRRPAPVPFKVTGRGFVPLGCTGPTVFIEFRLRPPEFTLDSYAADADYAAGALVRNDAADDDDGECYRALDDVSGHEPDDPDYWERQPLPKTLETFVKRAAFADVLRADGQNNKASVEEVDAFDHLTRAHDAQFAGQGQYDTARAQTY